MQRYTIYRGKFLEASKGDWVEWTEVRNALDEVLSCLCNKCKGKVEKVVNFQFFGGMNIGIKKVTECPICGGVRSQTSSIIVTDLIERNNLIGEQVTPGGRELIFKTKGRIHLSDECNVCDQLLLIKFLA